MPLARALALTRTLIGKKVLMAVTGVMLVAFVVGHMLGNLKVFQGAQHFNDYAAGLRSVGAPFFGEGQLLWLVRLVLLAALGGHVWAAYAVTRASWAARPRGYKHLDAVATTYAARTMRAGGILIVFYLAYHLLDLTFGTANPAFASGDAFGNLVASLERPAVAALYIVSSIFVGLHLYHGLWSAAQTLGLHRSPVDRLRRGASAVVAGVITLGYVIVPLSVLAGWVR